MQKLTLEEVGPENLSDRGIGCLSSAKGPLALRRFRPPMEWPAAGRSLREQSTIQEHAAG
jgi:hypothetical protein